MWHSSLTLEGRRVLAACRVSSFVLARRLSGTQVYNDHVFWSKLYHGHGGKDRFEGLPWVLFNTLPAVPWMVGGKEQKLRVMVTELLGESLDDARTKTEPVCAVLRSLLLHPLHDVLHGLKRTSVLPCRNPCPQLLCAL